MPSVDDNHDKHSQLAKWALWATVVAAVVAVLAFGRDVFDFKLGGRSPDPPAVTAPANDGPAPLTGPTDAGATESPPAVAATTPPENPADPSPEEEDQQQVTAKPTSTTRGAITAATISAGRSGQRGPTEWSAGSAPGFSIEVYTATGKVRYQEACFVSWSLINDGQARVTKNSKCASGGITQFSSGPLKVGDSMVTAEITTGWGAKARRQFAITVVP